MLHRFIADDGTTIEVNLAEPDALPSAYVLSVHKAGSTLLNTMATQIARAARRPLFALPTILFANGVKLEDCPAAAIAMLERPGTVFTGFRTPLFFDKLEQYRTAPKILLVRDPRDIAVSAYFSAAFSHGIPRQGNVRDQMLSHREKVQRMELSDFVLQGSGDRPMRSMLTFIDHLDRFEGFTVRRYEDVIFDKARLARDLATVLSAAVPDAQLDEIAAKNDVRPDAERPTEHIRQVTPGNYREHLSPEAQTYLETKFSAIFERFGYIRET